MKLRIIIKNNKYIPQRQTSSFDWIGFLYPTKEQRLLMEKAGIHCIQFDRQHEAEAFIAVELNKYDPDHQYVFKTYET